MAAAEIENGDVLFHRDAAANTWGVLNVREDFSKANPDLTRKVLAAYEEARAIAVNQPDELKRILVAAMKLPAPVVARQLERTDLSQPNIGPLQADSIVAAGKALLEAGVIPAGTDVQAATDALIDRRFNTAAR
jgi:sulfonate transport system substrate-binding protein